MPNSVKIEEAKKTIKQRLGKLIKSHFMMGIVIIIPLWLAYFVASILFNWVGHFTFPAIDIFTPDKRWIYVISKISSFFISIALVCLLGFLTNKVLGRNVIKFFEKAIEKIPMISTVYFSAKQFINFIFAGDNEKGFKQVVFVPYPYKGVYAAAFLTNEQTIKGENYICVFMPTTPNPSTGFLMMFKKEEVVYTDYTIDQAFQFIISVGVISLDNHHIQGNVDVEEIEQQVERFKEDYIPKEEIKNKKDYDHDY
ncbi:MAG: DUF502 domain-containing protein [Elusimicrobiota bacterium]|jgi:uncharacterized membrane protein|nr:DUF502 domain-containing protein [Elusimicrobiota bacterium]